MSKEKSKVVSIQELAKAYYSTDYKEYREVMNKANVSKDLQKRVRQKKPEGEFGKRIDFQKQEIRVVKKIAYQLELEAKEQEKNYEQVCKKVNQAEKEFRIAEIAWKKAKKMKEDAEKKQLEMEELLALQMKKLQQMEKMILLHPSATLPALDKKRNSILVCTKFDVERMTFLKFADCVMEAADVDIEVTKEMAEMFVSKQELDSAVEYAKLAIYFWLEDKPYELLYSSEGIKYILDTVWN